MKSKEKVKIFEERNKRDAILYNRFFEMVYPTEEEFNKVLCNNCNEKIKSEDIFCGNCGLEQVKEGIEIKEDYRDTQFDNEMVPDITDIEQTRDERKKMVAQSMADMGDGLEHLYDVYERTRKEIKKNKHAIPWFAIPKKFGKSKSEPITTKLIFKVDHKDFFTRLANKLSINDREEYVKKNWKKILEDNPTYRPFFRYEHEEPIQIYEYGKLVYEQRPPKPEPTTRIVKRSF